MSRVQDSAEEEEGDELKLDAQDVLFSCFHGEEEACQKVCRNPREDVQTDKEPDDEIIPRTKNRRWRRVHDVLCRCEDHAQSNDVGDVGKRSQPGDVEEPQANLKQDACHREDHCKAEAWLGEEETVPVGLHGKHRERQVGHPEDDSRTTERSAPGVEKLACAGPDLKVQQARRRRRQLPQPVPRLRASTQSAHSIPMTFLRGQETSAGQWQGR